MRHFFVKNPLTSSMTITGDDVRHISKVLRMQTGDSLIVVGPDGQSAQARICDINANSVHIMLEKSCDQYNEPPINVFLAQGLPKSDKMDFIVQKAVEIGAVRIYPLAAHHSVVHYDETKQKTRRERWQKIAAEAAKQCGRTRIPLVEPVMSLEQIIDKLPPATAIVMLYEGETPDTLKNVLIANKAENYLLLIGPEGGFSMEEVELVRRYGARISTMGPRIMRTETAALAALSIVLFVHGDLGG